MSEGVKHTVLVLVCIDGTRAQWFDAILHDFLAVWFYAILYTMRCTE